jgi:hypothetical protein
MEHGEKSVLVIEEQPEKRRDGRRRCSPRPTVARTNTNK